MITACQPSVGVSDLVARHDAEFWSAADPWVRGATTSSSGVARVDVLSPTQLRANSTTATLKPPSEARTTRSESHTFTPTHSSAVLDQVYRRPGPSVLPSNASRLSSIDTLNTSQRHHTHTATISSPPRHLPAPLAPAKMNMMSHQEQQALVQRLMNKDRASGAPSRPAPHYQEVPYGSRDPNLAKHKPKFAHGPMSWQHEAQLADQYNGNGYRENPSIRY